MHAIYCYTDMRNGMQYIGQTNNIKRRDKEHKAARKNNLFDNEYHAHPEAFRMEILVANLPNREAANASEKFWIDYCDSIYPNGYNLQSGGDSHDVSEKTRKIMSQNNSGEGNPMYGKQHTNETKRKISEQLKGKFAGNKNPMYGIHRYGSDSPRSKKCRCIELDKIFVSAKAAADWLKNNGWPSATNSKITCVCNGSRNIAYGYHWEYIDNKMEG